MGDKVRRLSDAIRLGATIHPQIHGNLFGWDIVTNLDDHTRTFIVTGTCALGAAAVAIGKSPKSINEYQVGDPYHDLSIRFPKSYNAMRDCPKVGCPLHSNVATLVTHLNDKHMWKREKIADWLEGLGF